MSRKNFLINKDFQLKVASYITGILILFVFLYPVVIYKMFDFILNIVGEDCSSASLDILASSRTTVIATIMGLQLILVVFVFIFSLYLSHRIAGPIYKLAITLKSGITGPLTKVMHFRKNDFFSEIADDYNELMSAVQTKLDSIEKDITVATQSPNIEAAKIELEKALKKIRTF